MKKPRGDVNMNSSHNRKVDESAGPITSIVCDSCISTFRGFLDLCPTVAECYRSVEYESLGSRIGIDDEVTGTLELISAAWYRVRQRRFKAARRKCYQRSWIDIIRPIIVFVDFIGVFPGKQVVVETNLRFDRMARGNPVNGPLYLATVRCSPSAGLTTSVQVTRYPYRRRTSRPGANRKYFFGGSSRKSFCSIKSSLEKGI